MRCNRLTEERAKAIAARIGLVYWKALLEDHGIDSRAFVYAERILRETSGIRERGNGKEYRVSWHNLRPSDVVAMWKAARKRNSKKFRFQVLHRIIAKKADTLAFLKKYQDGLEWVREWRPVLEGMPRKTIAILSLVSPEARHTLTDSIKDDECVVGVELQDLNWAGVDALEKLQVEGSERSLVIRAALLPPSAAAVLLGVPHEVAMEHPIGQERVRDFCPAYPNVSVEVAGRIALGMSPKKISNQLLSRKEAHQWLLKGGPKSLYVWAVKDSVIRLLIRDLPLGEFVPRYVEVARWLLHIYNRGAWSALLKVQRFPDGRRATYLNTLNEITPEDLDRGVSTGVERAFVRVKERLAQLKVDANDHSILCENPFNQIPKRITLLNSPAALVEEGMIMDHCVRYYTSIVEEGECLIFSIVSRHGHSTVEICWENDRWWLVQHSGYQNTPPPPRHESLVKAWLNRENQILQKEVS